MMRNRKRNRQRWAASCLVLLAVPAGAAGVTIEKVVISGDAAPDGNGVFATLQNGFSAQTARPQLNNQGQVAFLGGLNQVTPDTGRVGLFQGTTSPGSLQTIARQLEDAPGGDATIQLAHRLDFSFIDIDFSQNQSGQVAFRDTVQSKTGLTSGNRRVFVGNGSSLTEAARDGLAIPNTNFTLEAFNNTPLINDNGQVAVVGSADDPANPSANPGVILRFNGSTPTTIAYDGQANPAGGTINTLNAIEPYTFNNAGQVAYSESGFFGRHILRGDGTTLEVVAQQGDPAPDTQGGTEGTLNRLFKPATNDQGDVLFGAEVSVTFPSPNTRGVFRWDGNQLEALSRVEELFPSEGPGNEFVAPIVNFDNLTLNNAGDAVYGVRYLDSFSTTTPEYQAIFLDDGNTRTTIARTDDPTPTGVGVFSRLFVARNSAGFFDFALNESGQVAFVADIDLDGVGSVTDARGLFVHDGSEVIEIIRTGDTLFGDTVERIFFTTGTGFDESYNGFNDLGQVAFGFDLEDNRSGVAVASLPMMIPGDANGDGLVTVADFAILQNNFNMPGTFEEGDFNGDGFVTFADFAILQNNFTGTGGGASLSSSSLPAVVPEPAAVGVLTLGLMPLMGRRGRRVGTAHRPSTNA